MPVMRCQSRVGLRGCTTAARHAAWLCSGGDATQLYQFGCVKINRSFDGLPRRFVNGQNGRPTSTPGSLWINHFVAGSSVLAHVVEPDALKVGGAAAV